MMKIKRKSGIDTTIIDDGSPLQDIIIHLCIKDAVTCRAVIEVTRALTLRFHLPYISQVLIEDKVLTNESRCQRYLKNDQLLSSFEWSISEYVAHGT